MLKKLTYKKNTVIKKWEPNSFARRKHSISDWFDLYKEYQKKDPRCVEVYSIDQKHNTFEMERINGFDLNARYALSQLTLRQLYYVIGEVTDIYSNFFKPPYIHTDEHLLFLHRDLNTGNFIYSDKQQLRLVDPDSFCLTSMNDQRQVMYGKYFDTMIYLRDFLTR